MLKKAIDQSLHHLRPWMPWAMHEPEPLRAKTKRLQKFQSDYHAGIDYVLGVFNRAETELLGSTGLHTRLQGNALEIGYWVNSLHTGKGICTEIVAALTKLAFEVESLDRLEIRCDEKNTPSARIAQKCGYRLNEVKQDIFNSALRRTMIWEMKREDYLKNPLPLFIQTFTR